MDLISEYKGKKAIILKAFDKNNLHWEIRETQNDYGQKEFIITGDIINNIAEALNQQNTKPRTNFDKITESVESLAEFIYKVRFNCASIGVGCDYCPLKELGNCTLPNIKKWLQQECEERNTPHDDVADVIAYSEKIINNKENKNNG